MMYMMLYHMSGVTLSTQGYKCTYICQLHGDI